MRHYESELPLDVVADPGRRMYTEFGVERSWRAVNAPAVFAKAALHALAGYIKRERQVVRLRPEGGRRGLPADFLIAPDGRLLAVKYGTHAGDQWTVDDILHLVSIYRTN